MSQQFFPLEGAAVTAAAIRTALANSVCHLFKATLEPQPNTPLADYVAAEADYDGYEALTFATWNPPIFAPGTGYMIQSPLVLFTYVDGDDHTTNVIGGCFLVDAADKLRMVIIFTDSLPMQQNGQGIPLSLIWLFPTGQ